MVGWVWPAVVAPSLVLGLEQFAGGQLGAAVSAAQEHRTAADVLVDQLGLIG